MWRRCTLLAVGMAAMSWPVIAQVPPADQPTTPPPAQTSPATPPVIIPGPVVAPAPAPGASEPTSTTPEPSTTREPSSDHPTLPGARPASPESDKPVKPKRPPKPKQAKAAEQKNDKPVAQGEPDTRVASSKPPSFRCFVRDVMAFYDRTHVRCYNKARGKIVFFAVDTSQPIAATVLSKALNGMQMGKPVTITFAPASDLNPTNCNAENCRRLLDIRN